MKGNSFLLGVSLGIIIAVSFIAGLEYSMRNKEILNTSKEYKIRQKVENCKDENHVQAYTYVWYKDELVYTSRTWSPDKDCLSFGQIDSAKLAEHNKAVEFMKHIHPNAKLTIK